MSNKKELLQKIYDNVLLSKKQEYAKAILETLEAKRKDLVVKGLMENNFSIENWPLYLEYPDHLFEDIKDYYPFDLASMQTDGLTVCGKDAKPKLSTKFIFQARDLAGLSKGEISRYITKYLKEADLNDRTKLEKKISQAIEEAKKSQNKWFAELTDRLEKTIDLNPLDQSYGEKKHKTKPFVIIKNLDQADIDNVKKLLNSLTQEDLAPSLQHEKLKAPYFIANPEHEKIFNDLNSNIREHLRKDDANLIIEIMTMMEAQEELNLDIVKSGHKELTKDFKYVEDHKLRRVEVEGLGRDFDLLKERVSKNFIEAIEITGEGRAKKYYISYDNVEKLYNNTINLNKDLFIDPRLPTDLNEKLLNDYDYNVQKTHAHFKNNNAYSFSSEYKKYLGRLPKTSLNNKKSAKADLLDKIRRIVVCSKEAEYAESILNTLEDKSKNPSLKNKITNNFQIKDWPIYIGFPDDVYQHIDFIDVQGDRSTGNIIFGKNGNPKISTEIAIKVNHATLVFDITRKELIDEFLLEASAGDRLELEKTVCEAVQEAEKSKAELHKKIIYRIEETIKGNVIYDLLSEERSPQTVKKIEDIDKAEQTDLKTIKKLLSELTLEDVQKEFDKISEKLPYFMANKTHEKIANQLKYKIDHLIGGQAGNLIFNLNETVNAQKALCIEIQNKYSQKDYKDFTYYKDHQQNRIEVPLIGEQWENNRASLPVQIADNIYAIDENGGRKYYISYDKVTEIFDSSIVNNKQFYSDSKLPPQLNKAIAHYFDKMAHSQASYNATICKNYLLTEWRSFHTRQSIKNKKNTVPREFTDLVQDQDFVNKVKQLYLSAEKLENLQNELERLVKLRKELGSQEGDDKKTNKLKVKTNKIKIEYSELHTQTSDLIHDINESFIQKDRIYPDSQFLGLDLPKTYYSIMKLVDYLYFYQELENVNRVTIPQILGEAAKETKLKASKIKKLFDQFIPPKDQYDYFKESQEKIRQNFLKLIFSSDESIQNFDEKIAKNIPDNLRDIINKLLESDYDDPDFMFKVNEALKNPIVEDFLKPDSSILNKEATDAFNRVNPLLTDHFEKYKKEVKNSYDKKNELDDIKKDLQKEGVDADEFIKKSKNYMDFHSGIPTVGKDVLVKEFTTLKEQGKKFVQNYKESWKAQTNQERVLRSVGIYFTIVDTARVINHLYKGETGKAALYSLAAGGAFVLTNSHNYVKAAQFFKAGSKVNKGLTFMARNVFTSTVFAAGGGVLMAYELSVNGDEAYEQLKKAGGILYKKSSKALSSFKIPFIDNLQKEFLYKAGPMTGVFYVLHKTGEHETQTITHYMVKITDGSVNAVGVVNNYSLRPLFVGASNILVYLDVFSAKNMATDPKLKSLEKQIYEKALLKEWEGLWAWKDKKWSEAEHKIEAHIIYAQSKFDKKDWYVKRKYVEGMRRFYRFEQMKILSGFPADMSMAADLTYYYKRSDGVIDTKTVPAFAFVDTKQGSRVMHYIADKGLLVEYLTISGKDKKGHVTRRSYQVTEDGLGYFLSMGREIIRTERSVVDPHIGKNIYRFVRGHYDWDSYYESLHKDSQLSLPVSYYGFVMTGEEQSLLASKLEYRDPTYEKMHYFHKYHPDYEFSQEFTSLLFSKKQGLAKAVLSIEEVMENDVSKLYFVKEMDVLDKSGNDKKVYQVKNYHGEAVFNGYVNADKVKDFQDKSGALLLKETTDYDYAYTSLMIQNYQLVSNVGLLSRSSARLGDILSKVLKTEDLYVVQTQMKGTRRTYTLEKISGEEVLSATSFRQLNQKIAMNKNLVGSNSLIISPNDKIFDNVTTGNRGYMLVKEGKLSSIYDHLSSSVDMNPENVFYLRVDTTVNGYKLFNHNGLYASYETVSQALKGLSHKRTDVKVIFTPNSRYNSLKLASSYLKETSLGFGELEVLRSKENSDILVALQDKGRIAYQVDLKGNSIVRKTEPQGIKTLLDNHGISLEKNSYWVNLNWNKSFETMMFNPQQFLLPKQYSKPLMSPSNGRISTENSLTDHSVLLKKQASSFNK